MKKNLRYLIACLSVLFVLEQNATAQITIYDNTTTYGGYNLNGGAELQGTNTITRLVADDIHLIGTPPFCPTTIYFSVHNANGVVVSARPRIRFYSADGTGGGPGTVIAAYSFNPISLPIGPNMYYFTPLGLSIASNNIWVGMTFDNNGGTGATLAELNNLGMVLADPPTVGSSTDTYFSTTAAGSFNSSNPLGSLGNFSGSPVANFLFGFSACTTATSVTSQSTAAQTQCFGGTFAAITVSATGCSLSYQWYRNASNSNSGGTSLLAANGAQTYSYTPQATASGTKYYYCVVSGTCGPDTTDVSGAFLTNATTTVTYQSTAAQTQCYGGTFAAITVSATGDGLTYQWYSNASNSNSGGTTLDAANGAQTDSYTPQATASGTTYYYCVVSGTCGADTTDVSGAFLVRDKFRPGNTKGHQTIVYYPFTNDTDYTLLSDDVSEAVWDFTKLHDYYVSDDGFGNVLQTYQDGTAVDAATALANNAYFSLTLNAVSTLSLDSLLFEVGKGGSSDPRGFFIRSSIDGYTSDLITETLPLGSQQAPILHKLLLNASHEGISTVTFRFYLFSPSNSKSIDWRNLKFVYGETGETICNNENPAQINSLSPASGGDGPIAYQWQSSTDEAFTSPTDISSNTTSYDPPANLTATTWYRRQAKDGACNTTFTSSGTVWKVTVLPVFTAGTIDNTGQNICYNDDPAIIGNTTVASGGDGAITYQWQSSLDAAFTSPTDISSNTATYDPPANLTATTWYRRQAKDGTCNTTFTSSGTVWKVTVLPVFTVGSINKSGETICYEYDPAQIGDSISASGGDGTIAYQWQSSLDAAFTSPTDLSSNTATYDPPVGLIATTWYRRQAKDGMCNTSWASSLGEWKVKVYDNFNPGTIGSVGAMVCYGGDPDEIVSETDASGGDGDISYQWWSSTTGSQPKNFTEIIGATAKDYNPPAGLTVSTWYRRYAKDGTCNNFTKSPGPWKVTVYNSFDAGTIASTGQAICYNGNPDIIGNTADASGGNGTIIYQWQSSLDAVFTSPTDISSNTSTYDPPANLTATTWYRRQAKDGTCNTTFTTSGGVWKVNVSPTTALTGATSVTQGQVVTYSTPYNAGNSYTWNASHGNPQICFPNRNCLTLTWDFPCGIINPGYVTVTETDPSTGCSATVTQWITIAP